MTRGQAATQEGEIFISARLHQGTIRCGGDEIVMLRHHVCLLHVYAMLSCDSKSTVKTDFPVKQVGRKLIAWKPVSGLPRILA